MGYDFHPMNTEAGGFHMGAFLWPHFLNQCGAYFICISHGPKWYFVDDVDERMGHEDEPDSERYPRLIENSGFSVTAEEALVLARIARNYAAIQRSLPDQPSDADDFLKPAALQVWPKKIRDDWVDTLEQFAPWAELSGGFEIW